MRYLAVSLVHVVMLAAGLWGCSRTPAGGGQTGGFDAVSGDSVVGDATGDDTAADAATADDAKAGGDPDTAVAADVTLEPGTVGPPAPNALRTAYLFANSFSLKGDDNGATTVVAQFIDQDPSPLTVQTSTIGPCTVRISASKPGGGFPKYYAAGTVTITGGLQDVTLQAPKPGGYYDAFQSSTTPLWHPGDTLVFTATGAQVGGFHTTLKAPGHILISSPPWKTGRIKTKISRDEDLIFAWSGSSEGELEVIVQGPHEADKPRLHATCRFAVSPGTGAIPKEVLQQLDSGSEGIVSANVVSDANVVAGTFGEVTVRADVRALGNVMGNGYAMSVTYE